MASDHDDLVGAGISPRERLQRIEELLGVIDSKLDSKADATALIALTLRVATLEKEVTEHTANAAYRQERDAEMRNAVKTLEQGHESLKQRVAYAAGAAAVVVVVAEVLLNRLV